MVGAAQGDHSQDLRGGCPLRSSNFNPSRSFQEHAGSAKAFGMKLQSLEIGGPDELERTLATLKKQRADALVVLVPPSTLLRQQRILDFAAKNRLPAMYHWREYVDAGGLAFYGASVADMD